MKRWEQRKIVVSCLFRWRSLRTKYPAKFVVFVFLYLVFLSDPPFSVTIFDLRKIIDKTQIGKTKRPEFRFIFKKSERQQFVYNGVLEGGLSQD